MRIEKLRNSIFAALKMFGLYSTKIKRSLFVGAKYSGITSAVDALRKLLIKSDDNNFIYNDSLIKKIGKKLIKDNARKPMRLADCAKIVPSLDVWLNVRDEMNFISRSHYFNARLGRCGARLSYLHLPKGVCKLFNDYRNEYNRA
ncbi:MAG: hypothetical protein LBP22_02880 [Deltaproteobacteria bacterium]|nr:hypothetical protein [Deltaproteobacteria bacterium]